MLGNVIKELENTDSSEHEIKGKEFIDLSTTINEIKERKQELKRKQAEINHTIKCLNTDYQDCTDNYKIIEDYINKKEKSLEDIKKANNRSRELLNKHILNILDSFRKLEEMNLFKNIKLSYDDF
jgi:chromosome segregation ATPase